VWETDSRDWGTFGASQDGAPCTQRSVNLGEPGRVEDPHGESRWACRSTALEWMFRSDVVSFSGIVSVQNIPPTLLELNL
jgi:hypothetical protein